MTIPVEIKRTPPQPVLRLRSHVEPRLIPCLLEESCARLYARLDELGERPAGPPHIIYHGPQENGGIGLDVCVPTTRVVPAVGDIRAEVLPGGDFACIIHVGPSDRIADAYRELLLWADRKGLTFSGPWREVQLARLESPGRPPEFVIEILVPLPGDELVKKPTYEGERDERAAPEHRGCRVLEVP